jgi:hypothetical protein
LFEQAIDQRRFAVIDVSDNDNVSKVVPTHQCSRKVVWPAADPWRSQPKIQTQISGNRLFDPRQTTGTSHAEPVEPKPTKTKRPTLRLAWNSFGLLSTSPIGQ